MPEVLRSESSPKLPPAFVRVQAATAPGISVPSGVVIIACGIPRPLSVTVTQLSLIVTAILFAYWKLVRTASSIELSRISSINFTIAGTYFNFVNLPNKNRSYSSFEVEPTYMPGRFKTCSLSDNILISFLIILSPSVHGIK
ncbi:hypothetical protein Henu6_gp79 [Acinetobacter phage Henu6]|uniref:Uncharacterized protein n=1 Tax=Acinetobacter phage Henu6 TaxID=2500136 RepID=A0A410T5A4_9CAUD|nr:hypothetical protein Henu6_gp79 [Acinetobacter phage Henu6]